MTKLEAKKGKHHVDNIQSSTPNPRRPLHNTLPLGKKRENPSHPYTRRTLALLARRHQQNHRRTEMTHAPQIHTVELRKAIDEAQKLLDITNAHITKILETAK